MENPFHYGEAVVGREFNDRKEELNSLILDLKSNTRVFLISPRRYGKTSLIMNVLNRFKKEKYLVAYIDLYKVTSLKEFVDLYAKSILGVAESKIEAILRIAKELLPQLRPQVKITSEGETSFSFDISPHEKNLEEYLSRVYFLPEKIAKQKKKRFVIAFDEFQEIRELNGEKIERKMRSEIQHQHNVSYIFAGSKKRILYDMVYNENCAFYKIGKVMNLNKIPRLQFKGYLEDKFVKTGFKIEENIVETILNVTEDYPYNAQFLCHELWNDCFDKKRISKEDVFHTLKKILIANSPLYITLWDTLTLSQRILLAAIAKHSGKNIFSHEFIEENNLGVLPSVQSSIRLLVKRDILDKENNEYFITDVFFKEWIKQFIKA